MSVNFVPFNNDAVFSGIRLSTSQMPLNPTGNKEVEREIIQNSEETKKAQDVRINGTKVAESRDTDVDKEPEGNVPWGEIMRQLQLQATGNEDDDYNNIMEELEFQIAHAQTKYDLDYYEWMLEYTTRLFMSLEDLKQQYAEQYVERYKEDNKYIQNLSKSDIINMKKL